MSLVVMEFDPIEIASSLYLSCIYINTPSLLSCTIILLRSLQYETNDKLCFVGIIFHNQSFVQMSLWFNREFLVPILRFDKYNSLQENEFFSLLDCDQCVEPTAFLVGGRNLLHWRRDAELWDATGLINTEIADFPFALGWFVLFY